MNAPASRPAAPATASPAPFLAAEWQTEFSSACEQLENTLDREINEATSEWRSYLTDIGIAYRRARNAQTTVLTGMLKSSQAERAQLELMLSLMVPALTGAFVGALVAYGGRAVARNANSVLNARKAHLESLLDMKSEVTDFLKGDWRRQAGGMLKEISDMTKATADRVAVYADIYKSAVSDLSKNVVKEGLKGGGTPSPFESAGADAEEVSDQLSKAPDDWRNAVTEEKNRLKQLMLISGGGSAAGPAAAAAYGAAMTAYMSYLQSIRNSEFVLRYPTTTDRGLLDLHGLETAFEIMLWIQWSKVRDLPYWRDHLGRLKGPRSDYFEAANELLKLVPIERELVAKLRVSLVTFSTPIPADLLNKSRRGDSGKAYMAIDALSYATRPFSGRYLDVFKLANLADGPGSRSTVVRAMLDNAASGAFTVDAMDRLRTCTALV